MNKETLKAFNNIKAKLEKYEPKDALNLIDFILLEHAITPTNLGDVGEAIEKIQAYIEDRHDDVVDIFVNTIKQALYSQQSKLDKIGEVIEDLGILDTSLIYNKIKQILKEETK